MNDYQKFQTQQRMAVFHAEQILLLDDPTNFNGLVKIWLGRAKSYSLTEYGPIAELQARYDALAKQSEEV